MPWLLHTLPVNTLNFCAFSMCYAHAWGKTGAYENPDAATEANLNKETASILVAVPARDDKMAEVYQFPEERLRFVVPRAQTKDTGKCLISVQQKKCPRLQEPLSSSWSREDEYTDVFRDGHGGKARKCHAFTTDSRDYRI